MMASRVWTRAVRPTTECPAPSGPRWASARLKACRRVGSGGVAVGARTKPAMPHILRRRHLSEGFAPAAENGRLGVFRLELRTPGRGEAAGEIRIGEHGADRVGEARRILGRNEQAGAAGI